MLASVSAGIVVDRYAAPSPIVWWLAAGATLASWYAATRAARDRAARRTAAAILAAIACAAAGGLRHHGEWHEFSAADIGTYATEEPHPVRVEGVLVDAPRSVAPPPGGRMPGNASRTRFTLEATQIRDGVELREVDGLIDVEIGGPWPEGEAGDRATFFGRLARRDPPMNPGEFDFAEHYRADRKLGVLRVDSPDMVTIVERRRWWNLLAQLSELRREAHAQLLKNLPSDQAGFATALLLGYRDQMDAADNRAFFKTGTVHILSISGLHVAMLALFLQCGLRIGWVGRRTAAAVIIGVTIGYGLLIDAEPPAVRAVIVITAVGLATIVGRRWRAFNVLAASALLVLAMNPNDLFRTGPQLSFLAAAVLAWWAERRPQREPDEPDPIDPHEKRSLRRRTTRRLATFGRALLVSTAIVAITTPLVAQRFHIMSPVSLVLTPLLAVPVAVGLLFGLLTLLAAVIAPPLAPLFGAICGTGLKTIEAVVEHAQNWPAATYWLPGPSFAGMIAFYGLLGVWTMLPEGTVRRRRIAGAVVLGWGVFSMIPQHEFPADCRARCTFIAVDHGLAVLIESRDDDGAESVWLYDCGRLGSGDAAARSIAGVLWSRGITRLDGIVISHADADHYNGLPTLLEQFQVRRVVLSHDMARSSDAAAAGVRAIVAEANLPLVAVGEGDSLPYGAPAVECRVRHPPAEGVGGGDNASSLVVEVVASGRRLLLTGDLEGAGLKQLLAGRPLDCDVLLAPHHGSANSNPPGLAAWSRPEWVVVSGSADRGGKMRQAYEDAGARVLETTAVGAITVTIDVEGRIDVETFVRSSP